MNRPLSRRTLAKGAAWSVPVIVATVAAPAAVASTSGGQITFSSTQYVVGPNATFVVTGTVIPAAGGPMPSQVQLVYPAGYTGPATATVDAAGNFSVTVTAPSSPATGTLVAAAPNFGNGTTTLTTQVNATPAAQTGIVWGENLDNTLFVSGDGNRLFATTPTFLTSTQSLGAKDIVAMAGAYRGANSYLIRGDGTLWSHGDGSNATAPGTTATNAAPFNFGTSLLAGESLVDVAGFTGGGYVLTSAGRVFSWGSNTSSGSLGNGTTGPDTNIPKLVKFPSGVFIVKISASYTGGIAIDSTSQVWAWGINDQNDTGTLSAGNVPTPKPVVHQNGSPVTGATQIRGKFKGGLALVGDQVLSWGTNANGQLGNGGVGTTRGYADFVQDTTGAPLKGIAKLPKFYHEAYHAAALGSNGTLYTWGSGTSNVHSPVSTAQRNQAAPYAGVLPPGTISDVSLSYYGIHILLSDGSVWSWGNNTYGVGADGTSGGNKTAPVRAMVNATTPVSASGLFPSSHGGTLAYA